MNEPEGEKRPAASPDPAERSPAPLPDTDPPNSWFQSAWARLKHHKVVQWTLAYLAVAYTLLHGAERGNSRCSSRRRCARHSDRCASSQEFEEARGQPSAVFIL